MNRESILKIAFATWSFGVCEVCGKLRTVDVNLGAFSRDPREHWIKPHFSKMK